MTSDNLAKEIKEELSLIQTLRERLEKNPEGKGIVAEKLLQQVVAWVGQNPKLR